ncbi:hypothetical protein CRENBAI_001646 [Crenichthys baileyi]|uniref:Uncharacterized protein n=1 Tax=Crenichthys baileyi TaxID=28760 RepID=A0AAV9SMN9_9TELE
MNVDEHFGFHQVEERGLGILDLALCQRVLALTSPSMFSLLTTVHTAPSFPISSPFPGVRSSCDESAGCPCLTKRLRPAMNHGKRWTAKDTHNPSFKSGKRRTHLSAAFDRPSAPRCDVIGLQVRIWKDPAPELGHAIGLHMDPPPSCLLTNRGAGEKKAALLICIMKDRGIR